MPQSTYRYGWGNRIGGARKNTGARNTGRRRPARAAKYAGLVNAVLRRCAREGHPLIEEVKSQTLDVPPWLLARWIAHYGETVAHDIAVAIGHDPSLDLTV